MVRTRIKAENPDGNLKSYYQTYRTFSWANVEKEFRSYRPDQTNIVAEAIDRWAEDEEKRHHPALICERGGTIGTFTYRDLHEKSCQWANLLYDHGLRTGDRLFILLPSCPEIYLAMLGSARIGAIFCTLYPTLGYEEIEWMLQNAQPRLILTNPDLVERLTPEGVETVEHIFLTGDATAGVSAREIPVAGLIPKHAKQFENRLLPQETPLYLLYTSGSTGPPKGVVHAHQDMLGHLMTARYVLDLRPDSILWTDGYPAWVTGTVYGGFAPWLCGATSVIQGDPFSASTWYRTLERHKVTVWYTTPHTVRRLMEAGSDLPGRYDFSNLRHITTAGDTLLPEYFFWVKEHFKRAPHDSWWMTETGMICIANFPSEQIRPGSMGKPVPGIEVAILDPDGEPLPELTLGELALKVGWPSLMRAIWNDEERYKQYFRNGWFLTGDMAIKDEDGYFYHEGRNDDLIKVEQNFIGPYEIEQVIRLHPAIVEAAIIAKAAARGKALVKAFVTVARGFTPSARLNREIRAFVKTNLHSDVPLTEVEFIDEIPKTLSGKTLRRVLRARELGLPSGDPTKLRE